jgi:carbon-monoxide dehydrogenase medium subunit
LKWIDYTRPGSVREAVDLLAEHGDRARILAGGTDILVQLRGGRFELDLLVDVKGIPELNEISYDPGSGLTLGAAVPCHKIYADATVNDVYPGIIDVATLIGGTQIQGRATFGGNLCNAAPSADSIPILIALHATAKIVGPEGTREFAVEDMCTAPGQNQLKRGEMLMSMHFPPPEPGSGAHYMRFIPRNEMDIAVAGAGVSVVLDNGTLKEARVALASVAPTPLFVREAGASLAGKPANEESVQKAAEIARDAAKPITDMRGTMEYRRHLCEVLTRRALNIAIQRAKETR